PDRGSQREPDHYGSRVDGAMTTQQISIRVADDVDVHALARLRRAWTEENAGGPIEDAGFASAFHEWWSRERHTRTFFLVEIDEAPIGMANVKRYDRMPVAGRASGDWWGYVGNVFVLPAHRNRGVGQILMDELIRWASTSGAEHLRLAPSP